MSQRTQPDGSACRFFHELDANLRRLPAMNIKIWKGIQVLAANLTIAAVTLYADVPPKYAMLAIAVITCLFLSDLAVSRMTLSYGRLELVVNENKDDSDGEE